MTRDRCVAEYKDPTKPRPPSNVFVTTPFLRGVLDIRWDDPQLLCDNQSRDIVGVNIYRSQTGTDEDTWVKINDAPVETLSFRDQSTQDHVVREDVSDRFISRGNNRCSEWVFCTRRTPVIKPGENERFAQSPTDVEVYIDGVQVVPWKVDGNTGEIWLRHQSYVDLGTGAEQEPLLPGDSSTVEVSYYTPTFTLQLALQRKVHYKVTTVDSDDNETPLDEATSVTHENVETLGYIWREAIRRNQWILEQGGERVLAFMQKTMGTKCTKCFTDKRVERTHATANKQCLACYGTGFEGGYIGPVPIILAPKQEERALEWTEFGMKLGMVWSTWTTNFPLLRQRDFIRTQMGELFVIGPVSRIETKGLILQQQFNVSLINTTDIRYKVPIDDYVPLITDRPTVDDAIEIRGRTINFGNISY